MSESRFIEKCKSSDIKPNDYVLDILRSQKSKMILDTQTLQSHGELTIILELLQANLFHLHHFQIEGIELMPAELKLIAVGLKENQHLRHLALKDCKLGNDPIFKNLKAAILANNSLEIIDFSSNELNDGSFQGFEEILEINVGLKQLILDNNKFTECEFMQGIIHNESLELLSLSYNSLTFEALLNLMDIAKVNPNLRVLRLSGIDMEGPAPIKENPSGLLTKSEGIILILAQTLRQSYLREIEIDIDAEADVQLDELANTLTKYNRHLTKLVIPGVNWKEISHGSVLQTIYLAIMSNRWLQKNTGTDPPPEIAEIIQIKNSYSPSKRPFTPPDSFRSETSEPRDPRPRLASEAITDFSPPHQAETPHFSLSSQGNREKEEIENMYGRNRPATPPKSSKSSRSSARDRQTTSDYPSPLKERESFNRAAKDFPSPIRHDRHLSQEYISPPRSNTNEDLPFKTTPKLTQQDEQTLDRFLHRFTQSLDTFKTEVNENFKQIGNRVALIENKLTDTGNDTNSLIEAARKLANRVNKVEKSSSAAESASSMLNEVGNEIDGVKKKIGDLEKRTAVNNKNGKMQAFLEEADTKLQKVDKMERRLNDVADKLVTTTNKVKAVGNMQKEELEKIRSEKDEDRIALSSRMDRYEYTTNNEGDKREMDKVKRYIKAMESEIYQKINTREVQDYTQYFELLAWKLTEMETRQFNVENHQKMQDEKLSGIKPRENDQLQYISQLEDRVAELEREQGNMQQMKKKLADAVHKINKLEKAGERPPKTSEKIRKMETPTFFNRPIDTAKHENEFTPTRDTKEVAWPNIDLTLVKPSMSQSPMLRSRPVRYDSVTDRIPERPTIQLQQRRPGSMSTERPVKQSQALDQFLPGEAESVVMSAIIQKANDSRKQEPRPNLNYSQNFKSLSPLSASLSNLANYSQSIAPPEAGPSNELQNCLKQKGFVIKENRPLFKRDN